MEKKLISKTFRGSVTGGWVSGGRPEPMSRNTYETRSNMHILHCSSCVASDTRIIAQCSMCSQHVCRREHLNQTAPTPYPKRQPPDPHHQATSPKPPCLGPRRESAGPRRVYAQKLNSSFCRKLSATSSVHTQFVWQDRDGTEEDPSREPWWKSLTP